MILPCSSFHSALKRQLKADKKAREKETKLATVEVRVHYLGGVACLLEDCTPLAATS